MTQEPKPLTIPESWPTRGPDFNRWFADAAKFVAMVQEHPTAWGSYMAAKYLNIRVDTRDGAFLITNREDGPIDMDRLLKTYREDKYPALQPREAGEDEREVLAKLFFERYDNIHPWQDAPRSWETVREAYADADFVLAAGFRRASPSAAPVVTREELMNVITLWSDASSRACADATIAQHGGKIITSGEPGT